MKDLLTLDEIAELYEFSKYCIANNLKKNGIKPKNEKVGYLFYDAKEVDAVVRNIKHRKKLKSLNRPLWKVSVWNGEFWAVQHCSMSRLDAQKLADEYEESGKIPRISQNVEKR